MLPCDDAKAIGRQPELADEAEYFVFRQFQIRTVVRPAIVEPQAIAFGNELCVSTRESEILGVEDQVGTTPDEESAGWNAIAIEKPTIRPVMANFPLCVLIFLVSL